MYVPCVFTRCSTPNAKENHYLPPASSESEWKLGRVRVMLQTPKVVVGSAWKQE